MITIRRFQERHTFLLRSQRHRLSLLHYLSQFPKARISFILYFRQSFVLIFDDVESWLHCKVSTFISLYLFLLEYEKEFCVLYIIMHILCSKLNAELHFGLVLYWLSFCVKLILFNIISKISAKNANLTHFKIQLGFLFGASVHELNVFFLNKESVLRYKI